MTKMSIKTKMKRAQDQIAKQQKIIKKIQAECPHPEFIEGLTIIACVQSCWLCKDCGYVWLI